MITDSLTEIVNALKVGDFASVATLGRVEYLNENYFAPDILHML